MAAVISSVGTSPFATETSASVAYVASPSSRAEDPPAGAPEQGLQGPTVLVWLRQDLRTHDNVALDAAVKAAKASKGKVNNYHTGCHWLAAILPF